MRHRADSVATNAWGCGRLMKGRTCPPTGPEPADRILVVYEWTPRHSRCR